MLIHYRQCLYQEQACLSFIVLGSYAPHESHHVHTGTVCVRKTWRGLTVRIVILLLGDAFQHKNLADPTSGILALGAGNMQCVPTRVRTAKRRRFFSQILCLLSTPSYVVIENRFMYVGSRRTKKKSFTICILSTCQLSNFLV